MLDKHQQHDFKPHEADRLAVQLERAGGQVKAFGSKGSLVLLVVALVILLVVTLVGFNSMQSKFASLQPQGADASLFFSGKGRAFVGGVNPYPTVNNLYPTTQDGVSVCPKSLVTVSKTYLNVGESATLSVPSTWKGGSYHVTNPSVLSVSGNVITALAGGSSLVYGNDFYVGTSFPCTADAVSVTVASTPSPTPIVARFFDNHYQISPCGQRSVTVSAVSPVPGTITFDRLRNETGDAFGSVYTGPKSVSLIAQGDGSYRASITVNSSHFDTGLAAIYRLTGYAGYAAVSNVACN